MFFVKLDFDLIIFSPKCLVLLDRGLVILKRVSIFLKRSSSILRKVDLQKTRVCEQRERLVSLLLLSSSYEKI